MQPFATLTPLADVKEALTRRFGKLWTPDRNLYVPSEPGQGKDLMVFDPVGVGYDGRIYKTAGVLTQEADTLVYASGGSANANLRRNRVITGIGLVADPYRHDVTTATITAVQDAVDKLMSGLSIAGGPTYFSQNSTTFFMKGWANLCQNRDYHLAHNHALYHWSGVYFVDDGAPEDLPGKPGILEFQDPRGAVGMEGQPGNPFGRTVTVVPKGGLMAIFPSWLLHWVRPHQGARARISIAFNVRITNLETR